MVFNKTDVFREKIKNVPITVCKSFEDYKGDLKSYNQILKYIQGKFLAINRSNMTIIPTTLCALDRDDVEELLNKINMIIDNPNLVKRISEMQIEKISTDTEEKLDVTRDDNEDEKVLNTDSIISAEKQTVPTLIKQSTSTIPPGQQEIAVEPDENKEKEIGYPEIMQQISLQAGVIIDTPENDEVDGSSDEMFIETSGKDVMQTRKDHVENIEEKKGDNNAEDVMEIHDDAKCQMEFERFLGASIPKGIEKYLDKFKENEMNDIRYVHLLDEDMLKDDIKMNAIHKKKFMKCVQEYAADYEKFANALDELTLKEKYHKLLENKGIASLWSYYFHIKSIENILMLVNDKDDGTLIWNKFKINHEQSVRNDHHVEGQ